MRRLLFVLMASALCLAGEPAGAKSIFDKSKVYMSLMGEPFWAGESRGDPFDQWFKLADLDSDGFISRLEFRQDAEAFFTSLDTTGDKVIDADEMAQYEQLAPGKTRASGGGAAQASSSRPTPKSSAPVEQGQVAIVTSNAPSATRVHPGQGPMLDFTSVPQPVAMADLNIDRRVTFDEFTKTASKRFANYDVDQDGKLARKELAASR
jgi:Ca2+-binding EF-hand superfamily protein